MGCSGRPVPLRFHGFDEAAELRQEALLAERRCALQSGEAGALAAAAATYERQCARLQAGFERDGCFFSAWGIDAIRDVY